MHDDAIKEFVVCNYHYIRIQFRVKCHSVHVSIHIAMHSLTYQHASELPSAKQFVNMNIN